MFKFFKLNTKKSFIRFYSDSIAVGLYSNGELTNKAKMVNEKLDGLITEYINVLELKGKEGEKTFIMNIKEESLPKRIALIGIGEKKTDVNEKRESARNASGNAVSFLKKSGSKKIMLEDFGDIEGCSEGSHLSNYKYEHNKTNEENIKIEIIEEEKLTKEEIKKWEDGKIKAEAQNFARNLMNTPSNLMTPSIFASTVSSRVSSLHSPHVTLNVFDRNWINEKKMGCFESVTRGSNEPPVFLEMVYKKEKIDHLLLWLEKLFVLIQEEFV